jgi:dTMP kinase
MQNAKKLIVIEGLDGSGKSTQWEMLKDIFKQAAFATFPDYESHSGKIIKQYLNGEFAVMGNTAGCTGADSAYAASSFYAIDRYISHQRGKFLKTPLTISARYTSSNAIYQMAKLPEKDWEIYLDWLYDYEFNKLLIARPDLTVFLDVPLEISQELLNKRYSTGTGDGKDIHEGDLTFLKKCRQAAYFVAERDNWIKINCVNGGRLRSPDDINKELTSIITEAL